jgi:phosphoglycerate dehydrogenase-like enzyme
VTTSRGYGEVTAIAEYAIAGLLYFAKGFDQAIIDSVTNSFQRSTYAACSAENKTLCVVGAGGIGKEVARLARALGMQTLGIRSSKSNDLEEPHFDRVGGPESLYEFLNESDNVVVSCQWTQDTTNLLNVQAFDAMKEGTVMVNVARGEIVDESALLAALDSGRLRGAALDVFVGEFEMPPPRRLWQHPKVLITPHTSAHTDEFRRRSIDLFCMNLRRYLDGAALENQIDWSSGY